MLVPDAVPFSADHVSQVAQRLAAQPYDAGTNALPRVLRGLTYDQYRAIEFDRAQSLWADANEPFQVQPFHLGFLYEQRVALNEVTDGMARPLRFDRGLFRYGEQVPPMPEIDLGFAGARILHRLNIQDRFDEVVAFLGASYFRALGKGHKYGLSARGLAIGTAGPGGEEFPWFRSFWLERPAPDADTLVVHALLDSESVAGAYRFTIRPGAVTTMDVDARLYPRRTLSTVSVAPLTSMYYFGPNDRGGIDDYRPAVHDSDGLLMLTAKGERLWRPLTNPRTLQISGFAGNDPVGFGLMQRRRDFGDYQDLGAAYHRRPSLWVEPLDPWGAGEISLVEIPTSGEIHDNIVVSWRPTEPMPERTETRLRYRLHWCTEAPAGPALAAFISTRAGAGSRTGQRLFVLDAEGGRLRDGAEYTINLWAGAGSVHHATIYPNPETGGIRVAFELRPGGARMIELGCTVSDQDGPVTETWLYRWTA